MCSGWWFGTWTLSLWLSIYWECHRPNWRTHIFRGVGIPPTSHSWFVIYRDIFSSPIWSRSRYNCLHVSTVNPSDWSFHCRSLEWPPWGRLGRCWGLLPPCVHLLLDSIIICFGIAPKIFLQMVALLITPYKSGSVGLPWVTTLLRIMRFVITWLARPHEFLHCAMMVVQRARLIKLGSLSVSMCCWCASWCGTSLQLHACAGRQLLQLLLLLLDWSYVHQLSDSERHHLVAQVIIGNYTT